MSKPKSKRAARRTAERAAQKLTRERRRLALLDAGGTRERPMSVDSASVVEVRAEAAPCLDCGGPVRTIEHRAESDGQRRTRVAVVACRRCGAQRTFYFHITPALSN
jgi:D-serine deaminase-like pyridoxal phosphate-dependent protein